MDKSDQGSLTPANTQNISTAAASLAGRGLRDLQKANSKPQPKVQVDTLRMLPALAKVMDTAFRMGYYTFKENARFVLSECELITDKGLIYFSELRQLLDLDLRFCWRITKAGLAQLSHIPNIIGP